MAAGEQFRKLEAEGIASSTLPEDVRVALDGLSEAEVDALISAKQKLQAAAREVEGFAAFDAFGKMGTIKGESAAGVLRPTGPQPLDPDQFAHEGGFIF